MTYAHKGAWITALALSILLGACGGKSDADMVKAAKEHLAKGDTKSAVIELKSALQKNSDSGEARFLLGRALLETGDPIAATVELQKAADLKYSVVSVLPVLARALLEQGENKKIIESYGQFQLPDAAAQADLKTTVATAYIRNGARVEGEKALAAALAAAPNYPRAHLLKVRLVADTQDHAQALAMLDALLQREPANHEAWLLKGDLQLHGLKDGKAALTSYRKVLEVKKDVVLAHANIIELLLGDHDVAAATTQVAELKKLLPNHPQTVYFEGVLAYLAKDYKAAQGHATRLVQASPTNALALQLAGAAEFHLRSYQQAETYLAKAVQQAPGLSLARLLLAQVQLRSGQPTKTLATLAPVIDGPKANAEMLAVAAEAHLQNGEPKKSEELFARALKIKPDDPKIRTARAMGQMRQGKGDAAFGELSALAETDSGTIANMALISAHLRRNELDQALKAIDALEKKQPDKPLAANLRGRVQVLRKDNVAARASFDKALSIDANYFPALASLAALDLVENKPDQARKRFEDHLKTNPRNVNALLALANVMKRTGATKEQVAEVITQAVKAEPSQLAPRLKLVEHHLGSRDYKPALAAAQDGLAALPDHPDMLQALGAVHLAGGDQQQAITTLNKLVAIKSDSPTAHQALGEAYLAKKETEGAVRSFRKALELRPDFMPAHRGMVAAAIMDKRYPDGLTIARAIQKQQPTQGIGQLLEAEVEASRKNWDGAAAAYRASLQKSPSSETAIRFHTMLLNAGKTADADRFASGWEKDRPKDAAFAFHRGDIALHQRDYALAEARYRTVVQIAPQNALALNNVAWLMVQQGKPGAVEFAQKATQLLPNQPALLDTLATALAADKKLPQALEVQRKALALTPDDPALRLNLAKLLVQSGDKSKAREELQLLEKLGTKFPQQDKVTELMKSVNS